MQLYADESITGNVRPAAQFPRTYKRRSGKRRPCVSVGWTGYNARGKLVSDANPLINPISRTLKVLV